MLSFLSKKSHGKGVLVLKTDCFGLRGTVVTGDQNNLQIADSVTSREIDPLTALTEVITQLKNALGKQLPTDTLLLHINAVPDRVEINQDPNATTSSNLAEMMRWEMEGVVAEQSPLWDLGWLLIGRGYINTAQREELVQMALDEKRLSGKHGGRSSIKIGEIAIREHMATQDQVSECLQIQEKLQLPDQRLLTQWRPLPHSNNQDEYGMAETIPVQPYLCSAMPMAQHLQWIHAIKKVGSLAGVANLYLRKVYPFAGSTAPLIDEGDDTVMLTEFHSAYVFCALLQYGQIKEEAMIKCSSHSLDVDAVAEALRVGRFTDATRWIVANVEGQNTDFIAKLETIIDKKPEFLPKASAVKLTKHSVIKVNALAEFGAASHFFGRSPLMSAPLIGMPPPAPFYQSKSFKVAMAVASIPLAVVAFEGYKHSQAVQLQAKLTSKQQTLSEFDDSRGLSKQEVDQAKLDIAKYQQLEREMAGMKAKKELVEQVMVKRQTFIERLLPLLSESINDGVILDTLQETDWYQFTVTGRAVDQASIDNFNQVLSINLESLEMHITGSPSRFNTDSTIMQGGIYIFEFLIKRKVQQ